MVGRDALLAELCAELAGAAAGRGSVRLLLGEPGIGKSRLLKELSAEARSSGMAVLTGVCYEDAAAIPCAWLAELLDRAIADPIHGPLVEGTLSREPLSAFRGLLSSDPAANLPSAMMTARLLREVSAGRPTLLIAEDMHWSDEAGVSALLAVCRRAPDLPILVAVSARDGAGQGLDDLVGEVVRARLGATHYLKPLDEAAVAEMAADVLGNEVGDEHWVRLLWERTGGNPFFVEELLASVRETGPEVSAGSLSGVPVPRTVNITVRRRMRGLSNLARRIAEFASIEGRRFSIASVASGLEVGEKDALDGVSELVRAGFIDEIGPDQYAFRHALTQEAIREIVVGWERRRLHRLIADRIQARSERGVGHLADLSYHRFEAGDWKLALPAALIAAERDIALGAPSAALREIARAERAAAELQSPLPDQALRLRSRARDLLGDFESARVDLEAVLSRAVETGNRRAEWQATLDLGALWGARDYRRAGDNIQAALGIVSGLRDPIALAETLNRLGNWHMVSENCIEALAAHERARGLFESAGDADGSARTLDLTGTVLLTLGRPVEAADAYRTAAAHFRRRGDRHSLVSSLTMFSFCGIQHLSGAGPACGATLAERQQALEEALALSVGIEWRSGEALARISMANVLGTAGQLGEAMAQVEQGLALAEELEHRYWTIAGQTIRGGLLAQLRRHDEAAESLGSAVRLAVEVGSDYWRRIATGLAVPVNLARGDSAAAESALAAGGARDDAVSAETAVTTGERWLLLARAELALARNGADEALKMTTSIDQALRGLGGPSGIAVADVQARALAACGRLDEAIATWRAALELCDAGAAVSFSAALHARLARLLQQRRRRSEAETNMLEGRRLVAAIAASLPESEQRAYLDAWSRAFPQATDRQRRKAEYAGLTDREVMVARLIASGYTNASIAKSLVLSPRTVEKHVERILTKLNLATRSQVAVWTVRSGLATSAKDT